MRRLIIAAALALLVACGQSSQGGPALERLSQTVDGTTITLETQARPIMLQPQTWVVQLADAAGAPIESGEVYLDLIMPGMVMGQQSPLATAEGGGRYKATGFFTMDARWTVVVHADVAGADHQAQFQIDVQPQQ